MFLKHPYKLLIFKKKKWCRECNLQLKLFPKYKETLNDMKLKNTLNEVPVEKYCKEYTSKDVIFKNDNKIYIMQTFKNN